MAPSGVNLMMSTSGNEILQLDLQYLAEAESGESRSHLTRAWSAFGSGAVLAPSGSVTTAEIQAASPTPLATAFHSSRVTCMDACRLVPLLATAAQDRELRSEPYLALPVLFLLHSQNISKCLGLLSTP